MKKLVQFNAAIKSGDEFIKASLDARAAKYRFLANTYLAYIEGMKNKRLYKQATSERLGRNPTLPESKRPFLLLLHAIVGKADRDSIAKFSKLTSALEAIQYEFKGKRQPKINDIVNFITESGGVLGLYSSASSRIDKNISPIVAVLGDDGIEFPVLGARLTRVGKGYRLRLPDWEPGEYLVRLRVGRGGYLEAIVDDAEEAA